MNSFTGFAALITAIATLVASCATLILSFRSNRKITEVYHTTNSRLEALLEEVRQAYDKGLKEGREEKK
jgi:hypothetical protein